MIFFCLQTGGAALPQPPRCFERQPMRAIAHGLTSYRKISLILHKFHVFLIIGRNFLIIFHHNMCRRLPLLFSNPWLCMIFFQHLYQLSVYISAVVFFSTFDHIYDCVLFANGGGAAPPRNPPAGFKGNPCLPLLMV